MSWPLVKLGEIFEIARGGSPRPIDDYFTDEEDGLNWVSIKDASDSEKYIYSTQKKIKPSGLVKTREVKPGDFLLTNSMSFGRPYIMKTHGCIHDGWLLLRGNPNQVDQGYFYHLLGSDLIFKKFSSLAAGAVVKNLNSDLVRNVEVPLPPLEEQKRIAAILDKADAIRRKRQQAIKLADDFLRSVFLEMFGDPVTNPKGWDRGVFGDVIDVLTDYHANGSYETLSENVTLLNVPEYAYMVRTTDLEKGNFTDNVKYIDRHAYEHLNKSKVFGGEIIINKIGSAGAVYLMPNLGRPVSLAMNQFMIRCNKKSCNQFFYYQLLTNACQREILKRVQGAVTKTITKEAVRSIPMIIPSFEAQKKFSQIVDQFEFGVIRRVKDVSAFDKILFQSLSHSAFQGKL